MIYGGVLPSSFAGTTSLEWATLLFVLEGGHVSFYTPWETGAEGEFLLGDITSVEEVNIAKSSPKMRNTRGGGLVFQ